MMATINMQMTVLGSPLAVNSRIATAGLVQQGNNAGPPPTEQYPDTDSQTEPAKQPEVVLAEDNKGDVLLVREALELHGVDAHLTVHRDGEEMYRFIDQVDEGEAPCPDLVLLDLNLPKRDGQMLLARIRQSPVCAHVPIIVVTSSDSPNDREATARLGASSYFRKPSDFDEFMKLGSTVKRFLHQGTWSV